MPLPGLHNSVVKRKYYCVLAQCVLEEPVHSFMLIDEHVGFSDTNSQYDYEMMMDSNRFLSLDSGLNCL